MIVGNWWERNWKRIGECGDEGDSGWGYGRGPSGCSGGIGRQDIDFGSGQDDGKSDMLDDNVGGWKEVEPGNVLRSTRTRLVGEHVLHQIPKERKRPRCWRRRCG